MGLWVSVLGFLLWTAQAGFVPAVKDDLVAGVEAFLLLFMVCILSRGSGIALGDVLVVGPLGVLAGALAGPFEPRAIVTENALELIVVGAGASALYIVVMTVWKRLKKHKTDTRVTAPLATLLVMALVVFSFVAMS